MSQKDIISHIGTSCVIASTEYLALEYRTATACSNIDKDIPVNIVVANANILRVSIEVQMGIFTEENN